jgi:hypothetical protein
MAKQITGADADKVLTEEDRKRLIEEVTTPILKEAEERMVEGVRTRKPVKPLTRQEQIEATPEGQIPQRLRPGKPTSDKVEIPTTLPDHGIRSLYSDSELILERATSITGLPPESPANHYIAQTLAKGDPFSAQAMDNAKEETMKLVRAGVIPNPDYEGFGGFVSQAVDVVGPMAVELGGPMFTGIVSSPLLLAPEPLTKALWVGLQGTSSAFFNIVAQQMRIGSGMQEDTSYMEAVAAGGFGLIPGLKTGKDLGTAATVVVRASQSAGMGVGEDLTRQGLQVLFEEKKGIDLEETLTAGAVGAGLGAGLGRLEKSLVSYNPKKDPSAPILRKVLQDELKQVKKDLQRSEKRGAVNKAARDKVKKIEDKINALKPDEERVLQQAVDALDEAELKQAQEVAKAADEFQQSEAARVLKESDIQTKEQAGVSRAFLEYDEGTNPDWVGSMGNPHYKNVYNPETQRTAYMNKKGEIIDFSADTPIQVDRTLEKLSDDELEETLRVAKNDRDDLENWEDDSLVPEGDIEKVIEARSKVEALELEQWRRDVAWRAEDFVKNPEEAATDPFNDLFGKVWEEVKLDNDMANVKVAMAFEAIKKHKLEGKFRDFLKIQQRFLGSQVEAEDAEFLFETQMKKAVAAYKKFSQPQPKPEAPAIDAPTPKPEGEVKQQAREALDDFMAGGGTRDIDPETGKIKDTEDEVKARLLTSDTEKQRLINSVQDAIKSDLEKVKGGRVGKVQYLVKVQQELDRRLGTEAGNEFALVMRASQVTDNAQVADAIDQLGIHMAANGAIMVKGFDDVIKFLDGADLNNPEVINDAMVSIHKLIPAMMGWKKSGSASGRLLQSRKYTKDVLEVKQEHLKEKLEGNLVSDLKAAENLTPEQLDQQIKTFGEIEVVKKLLQAVQQADDISEVRDILVKQQEAFQSKSAKEVARKLVNDPYAPNEKGTASVYTKVRDVMSDLAYGSMLSSPVTHAKVAISNRLMSSYHRLAGFVGAKYMATVPWARNGLTREQFEEAGQFWLRASSSYGTFSEIANKEALRVLKTGDSDLQSHFERIGESAFSMERTGITGALGQSIENVGRFVDIPGKSMAAIDVRTRLNIAHSMTLAKAEMDYIAAKKAGQPVGEFQDFYNNFVSKVFNESKTKLLNEDQVRRKAILMAEKEGVKPEDLASYIDNFVKDNWNKDTSAFVDYVNRNLKEVTFTEEIGEFADPNFLEKGSRHIEAFLNTYPLLKTVLNPFMRTGRNITRGAMASTNSLVSLTEFAAKTNIPVTKAAHETAKKLWSKTAKDLESDDPIVAARAKGQQIVGAGVILAAYGLSEGVEDVFEFVGTESQDWKTKMNIRAATGMPEYTLRIGKEGEKQAISLAALEPLNTILSITADFKTLHHGTVAQREEARNLMEAAALAITNNIVNKSYYKNLGDAIKLVTQATDSKEATRKEAFKILKGLGSTAVPSIANTANYMSDDVVRENNNLLQVIARRMNGLSKLVPPMRDIFGDVQERGLKKRKVGGLAVLVPFGTFNQTGSIKKYVKVDPETGFRTLDIPKITRTTVRKDLKDKGTKNITKELLEEAYQAKISEAAAAVVVELGGTHHFNGGTSIWEKMDLEEIIHEETQQNAFDRWQELSSQVKLNDLGKPSKTGKTLKERIVSLASRADFKIRKAPKTAIPEGFEEYDERPADVSEIFRGYRNAALEQLKEEYPILVEQVEFKQELTEKLAKPVREGELEERRRLEQALPGTEFPLESYKKTQRPSKLEERLIPFRN